MINITLPDGSVKKIQKGSSSMDVALSISEGLARNVLSCSVNGEVWDLNRPIEEDVNIKLHTWDDKEGKMTFWHSSAHLMAEALEAIYPNIKLAIGPPIENGFYYDFDLGENHPLSSEDLPKIEKKMKELASKKDTFFRKEISKTEAKQHFKKNEYKLEILQDLEDGNITLYSQGNFTDLCKGPHIPNTSKIKAIKLLNIAGAYWKGDENRKQLTRIYGISFPKQKNLSEYIEMLNEAKKRDHRRIGKEMNLFTFSEKVGQGLPLWLPKGALLREKLENFLKKSQLESGYEPVITPHIGNKNLYITSGHYEKYGQDSFQSIKTPNNNEEFLLKPMNCPHHCEIFKDTPKSYKDLPIRYAEFGTVYRYEQSGELHGLTRVRSFTVDDAHIFCRQDQIEEEFSNVIKLVLHVFKTFNFTDYIAQISLRDQKNKDKYIGDDEKWNKAEQAIIDCAKKEGLETIIEYGEAAFYGPKLDFMVKDALGRSWQLGTIQVDYNLPERFDLEYVGDDNKKYRPIMIHRAPFGSMERFVAVLIEHCKGNFPLWLAPEQIIILPISEKYHDYANKILKLLKNYDICGHIDERSEKTGKKIRDAEISKIPYMIIIGEREEESNTISIRRHGGKEIKNNINVDDFIEDIKQRINNRKD